LGFRLKALSEEIISCAQCNYCRVCPAYKIEGWESISPRGRIYLLKKILEGKIYMDSNMVKDFFKCTVCGLCESVCQVGIPLINLWENSRNLIVMEKGPLPTHKKIATSIGVNRNPYGEDRSLRSSWLPDDTVISNSSTLYFAGCTASFRVKEIAESTVRVFSHFDIDFNYFGSEEVCCGSTLMRTGQMELAEKLVEKNVKMFERNRIERIVTTCAGCYKTFSFDYPEICAKKGIDFDYEVIHLSSFIEREAGRRIKEGMKAKLKGRATYHDPCHLGRHAGVYDEPRSLIKATGLELVEMEHSRDKALCCGAGGGVRAQFRDLSLRIGEMRFKEAVNTNADYLLSACPFCKLHLNHTKNMLGLEKPVVMDIAEIVLKVIDENNNAEC
jgi:Fe-S oxidoreductase